MPSKSLDPAFVTVLTSWFNLDSVDMGDKEELIATANVAAIDLARRYLRKNSSLAPLVSEIEESISSWRPDFVAQIINATSVDWLADDEYENTLREIVQRCCRD
ncbi:hypothetical protein LVJ94_31840 [Pendulispora rubella]|uniref:Uncharacterized protein n=1 Tax=Pendulispora rubella TaxID=2741070 RepID=A0ABZ2KW18_9BACT